jgi:hypothetical protein
MEYFQRVACDGWTDDALETNAQELSWAIFREAIDKSKDPFFPERGPRPVCRRAAVHAESRAG